MTVQASQCAIVSNPTFGPVTNVVTAITNAAIAAVTTLNSHGYVDGTIVRFDIPAACGMPQIDQLASPIVVTGLTTFTTLIDSSKFDSFSVPSAPNPHINICSLVVPIGELNNTLKASVQNIL